MFSKDARIGLLEVLFMAALGHVVFEWAGTSTLPVETHGALSSTFSPITWAYIVIFGCLLWASGAYAKVTNVWTHLAMLSGISINLITMFLVFDNASASPYGLTITIFSVVFIFHLIEAFLISLINMVMDLL